MCVFSRFGTRASNSNRVEEKTAQRDGGMKLEGEEGGSYWRSQRWYPTAGLRAADHRMFVRRYRKRAANKKTPNIVGFFYVVLQHSSKPTRHSKYLERKVRGAIRTQAQLFFSFFAQYRGQNLKKHFHTSTWTTPYRSERCHDAKHSPSRAGSYSKPSTLGLGA